jgi:hypothetical protein
MFRSILGLFHRPAAASAPRSIAEAPPTKVEPCSDTPRDQLGLLENTLQTMALEFDAESTAWTQLEIDILAGHIMPEEDMPKQRYKTFWEAIQEKLRQIKEAAESADNYLYELLEHAGNEIYPLQRELHKLLETSTESLAAMTPVEKQMHLVHICIKVISIMHGLQLMVNNFSNEITYCLDFEGMKEEVRDKLVDYAAGAFLQVDVPKMDHKKEMELFRLRFYANIAMPAGGVEQFISKARGDIKMALMFVCANKISPASKEENHQPALKMSGT